jgi:hypothetical protein
MTYARIGAGRLRTAEETVERRRQARAWWGRCDALPGTVAAVYLSRRGLPHLIACTDLRFRVCCHPSGALVPALVALCRDAHGNVAAVHRNFLAADGSGRTHLEPRCASRGPIAGAAIRLDYSDAPFRLPDPPPHLVVGEGIETAASAGLLLGLPAWSAIAAGNLARSMVLPPTVRGVTIAVDRDAPGERAAREAWTRWTREGRTVRLLWPDTIGADANDIVRARSMQDEAL